KIFYARLDEECRKEEKYAYLDEKQQVTQIEWETIVPDKKHTWLTEGLHSEFDDFMPLGTKETKAAKTDIEGVVFKTYGRGVGTSRDAWAYNFSQSDITDNMQRTIETYNEQVLKWTHKEDKQAELDNFVLYDDTKISWSHTLKTSLKRGQKASFSSEKIRISLYRPFTKSGLFFDNIMNNEGSIFKQIFPTPKIETENQVICCTNHSQIPFVVQITNCIPDVAVGGRNGQCFPFYTYNEDGSNRIDNITDWALNHYQTHYQDNQITKWDIFHYVYGLLHHPVYRKKYAANLKRELPRIPFAPHFWDFADAGKKLADLHLNYEQQPEYPLKWMDKADTPLDWRVEKMRLSRDKRQIIYNDSLTIGGIPSETFEYKLGNRAALDWVIDQYRIKVDKRSGIVNDPNRLDDEEYIVRLIGRVVFVSVSSVGVVLKLQDLTL
ncbi:MAG: helicase, partial [Candidatus Parabeggiatoa sp. nov. 3]